MASYFTILILLTCLSGCGASKIKIVFDPASDSNYGQPVYVVVRKVTRKKFLVENYNTIADMVIADSKDEDILALKVLLPGEKTKIKIEKPAESAIGIYGMFSSPENSWKILLNDPLEKKYKILLNADNISCPKCDN